MNDTTILNRSKTVTLYLIDNSIINYINQIRVNQDI